LSRTKPTTPDQGERRLTVYRGAGLDLAGLVARWVGSTPHLAPITLYQHGQLADARELSSEAIARWVVAAEANNSVRNRLSVARQFTRWAIRQGVIDADITDDWAADVRKRYPRLYGKQQQKNPPRRLTYHEAYEVLIPACQDRTWIGSRDQLAIRLGLLGLRGGEVIALRWTNLHPDGMIRVLGKGNRIRQVKPGPTLTELLNRWRRHYEKQLGRPVNESDPLLCCQTYRRWGSGRAHPSPAISWGKALGEDSLAELVAKRGTQADLGHLTPHDLRRSAARILHEATTTDGAHLFDLLDIQEVLDHADPATTQRSYIGPLGTAVKVRAGGVLD
jgi:integrase